MNNALRAALVWGVVCFLLLYCALPVDIAMSWQMRQQFGVPWVQLIAVNSIQIIPAMIPLLCFVCLMNRIANRKLWLLVPAVGWFIGKLVVLGVLYIFALKIANVPLYAEGYFSMLRRVITAEWLVKASALVLAIITCSYAWRRETRGN
ncbi:hypothetical protein L579_1195 [Pantoea sp. AS-PWVM4]|uniref:hypothetical protein n=1 Tax=Pantoea sp. AS-PWVM4 TaxID=1332069 RepID=UPI0003AC6CAA|nr:hypothetical protein [Pantoea sp. AS-PWVM4]ERK09413.1 hypothetical protein L579_1195 [Pantoea sp. AS-PWVM4]